MLFKHLMALMLSLSLLLWGFWGISKSAKSSDWPKEKEMLQSFIPFEHLDFNSNTSDLDFLKQLLSDKQIVLLGEQLHQDGTTIQLKARLARMLHEELGFNVLIYESGYYDTDLVWEKIQTKDTCDHQDFLGALWPFWVSNEESLPLIEYICEESKSQHPLQIAGIDVQMSGSRSPKKRRQEISSYFKIYPSFDSTAIAQFSNVLDSIWYFANPRLSPSILQQRLDSTDRLNVQSEIQYLRNILLAQDSLLYEDQRMLRYLQNIGDYLDYVWQYRRGHPKRFHIRDSLMADNFLWLQKHQFADQKLIVWLSNKHAINESDGASLEMGFRPTGDYLKKAFKDQAYSIGFTSFARESGNYNASRIKSGVEEQLAAAGLKLAFIDFQELSSKHPLSKTQYMRFDEGANRKGIWPNLYDGAIFIDTIQRLTPLENE